MSQFVLELIMLKNICCLCFIHLDYFIFYIYVVIYAKVELVNINHASFEVKDTVIIVCRKL